MKRLKLSLIFAGAMIALGKTLFAANEASAQLVQRMAVPSYFYPGPIWTKLEADAPIVKLTIINPNSGPNTASNADYAKQVIEAKSHGLVVIGYVDTGYGKRPIATVEDEVKRYFQWYRIDGVFFDEVASGADELPYYTQLYKFVHTLGPRPIVVLNPGTYVDEGYMAVGDIICTWETGYSDYVNKFESPKWVLKYPARRFWHIVYEVPTDDDMKQVVSLAKQRHAGWVYATSFGANNSNPYADLPAEPYWSDEINALHNP